MTPKMVMPASDTQRLSSQREGARLGCVGRWQGEDGTKKCSIKVDGSERGASRNWMVERA